MHRHAPLALEGRRRLVESCQKSNDAHVADRTLAHGVSSDLCVTRWSPPNRGLSTSTNRCCPEFRDHVNFDARAEWHLRHTDGTAGMDAPLAEHLDK